ncbi:MAG: hypothetical protein IT379_02520 [Deltaproteobacteria bacterium]|nr:hypothetical protein [Deltaproteobacteria bacterium]
MTTDARRVGARSRAVLAVAAVGIASFVAGTRWERDARGALPPRYGGSIRLPSPSPVVALDPATATDPFAATIAAAVFDPLYRVDASGMLQPVLAEALPVRQTPAGPVVLRVRSGIRFHHGRGVTAGDVVATLRRAGAFESASWAVAPLVRLGTQPDVRALDRQTVEIRTALDPIRVARLLAVPSLAIVPARFDVARPSGTGPFQVALRAGAVTLSAFRDAAMAGPYLDRIAFDPPRARNDELRALELGAIDGSWIAPALYRRSPARPVASAESPPLAIVLLVLNPSRPALRDAAVRAHVAAAIDRAGLGAAGVVARTDLAGAPAGIAPRAEPSVQARHVTLTVPVVAGDAMEHSLAELLVAQLDEAGVALQVEPVPAARYPGRINSGDFDLRIAVAVPAGPDPGGEVAAALAAAGQGVVAADLAVSAALWDEAAARAAARRLSAVVLGRRRIALHARADLRGTRFDPHGRLVLGDMWLSRPRAAAAVPHDAPTTAPPGTGALP